jgi:hypothetical protein
VNSEKKTYEEPLIEVEEEQKKESQRNDST